MTDALYEAAKAGVQVDLIVRGFCCLRPGVAGLSENIRVISIVGRFLEHSRIYWFSGGADDPLDGDFFIGSADWMYRNLHARVEAITPVEGRRQRQRLWETLQILLADQVQRWDMKSDGSFVKALPDPSIPADDPRMIGTHQLLMNLTLEEAAGQRTDSPS